MHVLNNFLAFGLALAFSDMTAALNPTGRQLVEHPVDADPVAGLPGAGALGGPRDGARRPRARSGAVLEASAARV